MNLIQNLKRRKKLNLKIEKKLIKLFKLNKKNPNIKNNHLMNIMINTTLLSNAPSALKTIKNLIKQIITNNYIWRIEKKKKFSLTTIQKLIKIILDLIYEPIFQILEYNHGFRPKKNYQTAIQQLQTQSQNLHHAFKGQIRNIFKNITNQTLLQYLNKKIIDSTFLKLIENLLRQENKFKNTKIKTSQIIFNIYLHSFDLYIYQKMKKLKFTNQKHTLKINILKNKPLKLTKNKEFKIQKFKKLKKILLKNKTRELETKNQIKKRTNIRISYNRYINQWIIITNYRNTKIKDLKKRLLLLLLKKTGLKWHNCRISALNLNSTKTPYLIFTLFVPPLTILKTKYKSNIKARRKKNNLMFIGMNHKYLKTKLKTREIISSNYKPKPVIKWKRFLLKPYNILKEFKQKLITLIHYYYSIITCSNDLRYYYYAYKFSYLKTLKHQIKKKINYNNNTIRKKNIKNFPSYLTLINKIKHNPKKIFSTWNSCTTGINFILKP